MKNDDSIAEALQFGKRVNAARRTIDKWLEEFGNANGYQPTRIWTPVYPQEWADGEVWIGCLAIGREIRFPITHVFPRGNA